MAQIKKDTSLRKAILQAAITGQLISDVEETTETGKQLLDRIIEERNKKLLAEWEEALKKNSKTKKPAPIVASEIDEDEIPFEIPENWCWCRFGEIMINRDSERIPLSVSQRELLEKKYDYYGASGVIDKVDNYLFDKDLLLIGEDGANLLTRSTPIAFIASGKYWVNNHAHVLDCDAKCLNINYVKYFINAISLAKYVTGTAQPKMNQEKMNSIPVALPPLSVQNAIVAKLEQVLPLVDAYENAVLQKEELKSTLSDKVKKAILQEAITGKLTEQWRKSAAITESGEQLLDRIIKERNAKALAEWEEKVKTNPKAKKPVPVVASEIEEDEIPFEVPESWCWCRLSDVIDLLSGRDLEPNAYNSVSKGIPYMTGASNFENEELIVNRWTDKPVTISSLGDLFITCKGTIGELAFNRVGDVHIARQIMAIRKTDYINLKFLKFFLMSRVDEIQKQAKSMIPGISREDMLGFYFPLPPLEEQKEIIKKVEELLPLCK